MRAVVVSFLETALPSVCDPVEVFGAFACVTRRAQRLKVVNPVRAALIERDNVVFKEVPLVAATTDATAEFRL